MQIKLKAEEIEILKANAGDVVFLESLRQSVIPPFLMLMPFCELPDFIELLETKSLGEDGIHGAIFILKIRSKSQGNIIVGFKDLQSGKVTHKKVLRCITDE